MTRENILYSVRPGIIDNSVYWNDLDEKWGFIKLRMNPQKGQRRIHNALNKS